MLASAPVGGGLSTADGLLNVGVPGDYARTDLEEHAGEVRRRLGLGAAAPVLFTAADLRRCRGAVVEGVRADATVGLADLGWAACARPGSSSAALGTINLVVQLPVPLTDAALVNAVITATEAKVQALLSAGFAGTGTPTDAVVVAAPLAGAAVPFAGPRAPWGARIARAVFTAVAAGALAWRERPA